MIIEKNIFKAFGVIFGVFLILGIIFSVSGFFVSAAAGSSLGTISQAGNVALPLMEGDTAALGSLFGGIGTLGNVMEGNYLSASVGGLQLLASMDTEGNEELGKLAGLAGTGSQLSGLFKKNKVQPGKDGVEFDAGGITKGTVKVNTKTGFGDEPLGLTVEKENFIGEFFGLDEDDVDFRSDGGDFEVKEDGNVVFHMGEVVPAEGEEKVKNVLQMKGVGSANGAESGTVEVEKSERRNDGKCEGKLGDTSANKDAESMMPCYDIVKMDLIFGEEGGEIIVGNMNIPVDPHTRVIFENGKYSFGPKKEGGTYKVSKWPSKVKDDLAGGMGVVKYSGEFELPDGRMVEGEMDIDEHGRAYFPEAVGEGDKTIVHSSDGSFVEIYHAEGEKIYYSQDGLSDTPTSSPKVIYDLDEGSFTVSGVRAAGFYFDGDKIMLNSMNGEIICDSEVDFPFGGAYSKLTTSGDVIMVGEFGKFHTVKTDSDNNIYVSGIRPRVSEKALVVEVNDMDQLGEESVGSDTNTNDGSAGSILTYLPVSGASNTEASGDASIETGSGPSNDALTGIGLTPDESPGGIEDGSNVITPLVANPGTPEADDGTSDSVDTGTDSGYDSDMNSVEGGSSGGVYSGDSLGSTAARTDGYTWDSNGNPVTSGASGVDDLPGDETVTIGLPGIPSMSMDINMADVKVLLGGASKVPAEIPESRVQELPMRTPEQVRSFDRIVKYIFGSYDD